MSLPDAQACVGDLRDLPMVRYAQEPFLTRGWELRDNLTEYDAVYVALAEALGGSLVTGDRAIARTPGLACDVETIAS